MSTITLTIDQTEVYKEVAKTTSYTGSKMDDGKSYDRIFTTDEDQDMLSRFWDECKNSLSESLKKVYSGETETSGVYKLSLALSNSFDQNQVDSMQRSLFSFFVVSIISKWYVFVNKPEAAEYSAGAASYLDDVLRKAYFKKRPTRPTYS